MNRIVIVKENVKEFLTKFNKLCKDFSESNDNSCIRQVRDYLSKDYLTAQLFKI